MRRWTIALVALGVLLVVAVGVFTASTVDWESMLPAYDDGRAYDTQSLTRAARDETPQEIEAIKDFVRARFGDELESIDVRPVMLDTDPAYAPTPYALTYRVRGVPTSVSGLGGEISDFDYTGLVPGAGRVPSELTVADFRALAAAFAEHSSQPMGYSYSYVSELTERTFDSDRTITVAGRAYKMVDLWSVNEGWVPPVGEETWIRDLPHARALVFLRDRRVGTFTYVGTESSPVSVYPWDL